MPTWLIVLLVIILLLFAYVMSTYNALVTLRQKVKNQWSQIDIQLKRRADLIPNIVETVKGYAKHEKETLDSVIKARNTYLKADSPEDQMASSGEMTQALGRLFALSESYPELKADKNFAQLQTELTETEDKISYARQFYNDVAMKFNAKIEMFPSNIIANMFKFTVVAFFEATEKEKENVQVKF